MPKYSSSLFLCRIHSRRKEFIKSLTGKTKNFTFWNNTITSYMFPYHHHVAKFWYNKTGTNKLQYFIKKAIYLFFAESKEIHMDGMNDQGIPASFAAAYLKTSLGKGDIVCTMSMSFCFLKFIYYNAIISFTALISRVGSLQRGFYPNRLHSSVSSPSSLHMRC
ncbi:hypothetical protein F6P95_02865 [Escherichia coli]|nr:hypothetical protein F6P95_02865 [Escherichia coli]